MCWWLAEECPSQDKFKRNAERYRLEKKIVALQNGETEGNDEISEAKICDKEDKRVPCMREEGTGGKGNVKNKTLLKKVS